MTAVISFPLETIKPFRSFSADLCGYFREIGSFELVAPKTVIFQEGQPAEYAYLLISGRVAMQKTSPNGKDLIVELIFPNELFGILGMMEEKSYPLSAEAKTESGVLRWHAPSVRARISQEPGVSQKFSEVIFQRFRETQELARAIAHDQVESRVGAVVSALFARIGEADTLKISRQEIADLCGINLETASRVIKNFEKQGLLDASEYGSLRLMSESPLLKSE